jgi:hypothetical protein
MPSSELKHVPVFVNGSVLIPAALQPPAPLSPELVAAQRATYDAEISTAAERAAIVQAVNAATAIEANARKSIGGAGAGAEILAQRRRIAAALQEQLNGI